jgi:tetratricopeptide (TPR) repeat protein
MLENTKSSGDRPIKKGDVGYKRPPVSGQFKRGKSGNAGGRPKGRPNVATLTKALFNAPVTVREGGTVRRMSTGEAIFRSQVAQAGGGDERSLLTVMDILEMTGRTKDVSDEEREKRALHLSNAFTRDEWDLFHAQTREKERERCRMIAESDPERYAMSKDGVQTVEIPLHIKAGDGYAAHSKFDEALASYQQEIAACKKELTADDSNVGAQERFRRAVARIGLIADTMLLSGNFRAAVTVADEALREGATKYWVPKITPFYGHITGGTAWIRAVRAHACMLAGQVEEAQTFYLQQSGDKRLVQTSWETSILRDFVSLRKAGYSHPLMDEIEKRYADEGWTTGIMNIQQSPPEMKGEDTVFIQQNPDSLKSGDILRNFGQLDEAMAVYLRNLKKWKTNFDNDRDRAEWKQNFDEALDRVVLTTKQLFQRGRFNTALECAENATAIAPDELLLQAIHGCALIMIGSHNGEARTLLLCHRGKMLNGRSWEAIVGDQFEDLRKAGCERPLMEEIERRFAGIDVPEVADNRPRTRAADSTLDLVHASDVRSGEMLAEQCMFDEALAVYLRAVETIKAKIDRFSGGQYNVQVIDDRNAVIDQLANLSLGFLRDHDFVKALEAIEGALGALPQSPRLNIYRAHVLMCLERLDEAKSLYLRYRREKLGRDQLAETAILQDFHAMRRAGLSYALQDEIEAMFTVDPIVSKP